MDGIITMEKMDKKQKKHFTDLAKVTTISELQSMYGIKYRSTIVYAIDYGHIVAVQSGSIWLISLDSAIEYYGKPKNI